MSNVTQHTNMKKWLYALVTFLFLILAMPVSAQEQCNSFIQLQAEIVSHYGDAVFVAAKLVDKDKDNFLAAFNALPPESSAEADSIYIYKHKEHPEMVLVALVKGNCVDTFVIPLPLLNKLLPTRA